MVKNLDLNGLSLDLIHDSIKLVMAFLILVCFEHFFFCLLLDLGIFLCMQVNADMMLKRYAEV